MTSTPARFIDLHLIQSVPYANLNRDDTNAVKRVYYGGVERTRVSSQCWKRATRPLFEERIGDDALRTRRFGEHVARTLAEDHDWTDDLARLAGQHLTVGSGLGADKPKKNGDGPDRQWSTNTLVFMPRAGLDELVDLALAHRVDLETATVAKAPKDTVFDPEAIRQILASRNGVVNVYGRMLAEIDDAKVDSTVQVAHAFTTHETATEIDYFAAVDDLTDAWGDTGSGHIGENEFSAGTFYRYATIDLATLRANLNGHSDARTLTRAFIEAFILSMPQAKRSSTAPHTIPSLVHIAARSDRPVSLARAFEQPVNAGRDHGYDTVSQEQLAAYATKLQAFLGPAGQVRAGYASVDDDLQGLGERAASLPELIDATIKSAFDTESAQ
jgi:CRISPR system Cascade subunit CasC